MRKRKKEKLLSIFRESIIVKKNQMHEHGNQQLNIQFKKS